MTYKDIIKRMETRQNAKILFVDSLNEDRFSLCKRIVCVHNIKDTTDLLVSESLLSFDNERFEKLKNILNTNGWQLFLKYNKKRNFRAIDRLIQLEKDDDTKIKMINYRFDFSF